MSCLFSCTFSLSNLSSCVAILVALKEPDRHRAGSIQPEVLGIGTFVLPKSSQCSQSKFLTGCSCQRPKSALFNPRAESTPPQFGLTAEPVTYILEPLLEEAA